MVHIYGYTYLYIHLYMLIYVCTTYVQCTSSLFQCVGVFYPYFYLIKFYVYVKKRIVFDLKGKYYGASFLNNRAQS